MSLESEIRIIGVRCKSERMIQSGRSIERGPAGPQGPKGDTGPKGEQGSIENLTINGKTPDDSGTVTLTAADVGAATAEEVSQLKADVSQNNADIAVLQALGLQIVDGQICQAYKEA